MTTNLLDLPAEVLSLVLSYIPAGDLATNVAAASASLAAAAERELFKVRSVKISLVLDWEKRTKHSIERALAKCGKCRVTEVTLRGVTDDANAVVNNLCERLCCETLPALRLENCRLEAFDWTHPVLVNAKELKIV